MIFTCADTICFFVFFFFFSSRRRHTRCLSDWSSDVCSSDIDWNNGNDQYLTLTGNCTLTLSNPMSGFRYALFINTGAGGFTPTFPGSIIWMDAVPTLPTTASKIYVAVMVYIGPLSSYTTNFTKQP